MALLTPGYLGLLQIAKLTKDGGAIAIAEVLNEIAEIQDMVWSVSNGATSHTMGRRTTLPSGTWRKVGEHVSAEVSTTQQVVEQLGILETFSKVDQVLAEMYPRGINAYREMEDTAFIEGLGQTFMTEFFYGAGTTDDSGFRGLADRMSAIAATTNVIDEGGTGSDLTSAYVVEWGPRGVFMLHPPGATAGLGAKDLGEQVLADSSENLLRYLVTNFRLTAGLAVADDRSIQRLANIETAGASNTFDEDNLLTLVNRLPGNGQPIIYVNQTLKTQMDIAMKDATNVRYTMDEFGGRPILHFRGIPIRQCDAILDTEDALS